MPNRMIQNSFSTGEVSPSLYARTDINRYRTALKTCRNFIIHPTGGVSNRPGFKLVASAKSSSAASRLVRFVFSETQAYVLEFGNLYVRFYTDDAQITNSGTPYEVATPYTTADLDGLNFESSADVMWITHPDYQPRTLTRYGDANWVLSTFFPTNGPFMVENVDTSASLSLSATTGSGITLSISSAVDTYTSLLLHCDGIDAATTFTDETGKTVTAHGNAQVDIDQSVFGGASALFDGTGDYLSVPDSSAFAFGTGAFTLDFRVRFAALPTNGNQMCFLSQTSSNASGQRSFKFFIYNNAGQYDVYYEYSYDGSTGVNMTFTNVSVSVDTWYHIALVRNSNNLNLYINGTAHGTTNDLSAHTTVFDSNHAFEIGASPDSTGGAAYLNGWMDEIRISKGIARWTSGFTPETSAYNISNALTDFVFSPDHVGALFKLRHYVEGQTVSTSFSSATTSSSISCFGTWRLITHGTWTGKLKIEKSSDGGTTWTVLRTFTSADDFNPDTYGTEDEVSNPVPFLVRANMYSYTSGTANVDLTTDPFYQDGIVQVTSFTSTTEVLVTVIEDAASTSATTSWSEGSWSDYRGWPSIARFHQDRLVFASTYSEPMTIWMSETGIYNSFKRHQTLLDTDGISVQLPSRQLNAINGLIVLKELIALTSASEWTISTIGDALTPTGFKQSAQGYNGSYGIAPEVINSEAIFVQAKGKVIRNIGYTLEKDGFSGSELNIMSQHLFEGKTVLDIAYQQNPDRLVWCLLSDGTLVSLTYMPEQDVISWARHDTDGTIESICIIPGSGYDELWIAVSRTNGRYVERLNQRITSDPTDSFFVDSGLTYDSTPATVFSGLDHLEGETVSILADGIVQDQDVVDGGTITLSQSASTVHIGLPYNCDFETLNIDSNTNEGTIQGRTIKIGNITFRLLNSRGGYIGPDSSHLYEAFTNTKLSLHGVALKDAVGSGSAKLYNCDIRVPVGSGYSTGGRIFYRQSDPLPITIIDVVPEIYIPGQNVT